MYHLVSVYILLSVYTFGYPVIWIESILVHITQLVSECNAKIALVWFFFACGRDKTFLCNSCRRFKKSNTIEIIQKLFWKLEFLLSKSFHSMFSLSTGPSAITLQQCCCTFKIWCTIWLLIIIILTLVLPYL